MKKRVVLIDGVGADGPLADTFEPTHLTKADEQSLLNFEYLADGVTPDVGSICQAMQDCEDGLHLEDVQQRIRTECLESVLDLQEMLLKPARRVLYTNAPLVDGVWAGHSDPHVVEEQLAEVLLSLESWGVKLFIITTRAVKKYGALDTPQTLIEIDGDWYDLRLRCGEPSNDGFAVLDEGDLSTISLEEAYAWAVHCCRRTG